MANQRSILFIRLWLVAGLLASIFLGSGFIPVSSSPDGSQRDAPGKTAQSDLPAAAPRVPSANPPLNIIDIPAIPIGSPVPVTDGECGVQEYSDGSGYGFQDGPGGTGSGTINLVHDANYLYVCIFSPNGSDLGRFDSLYLDPQGNGTSYTFAQQDDFSLRIYFSGNTLRRSFRGNGIIGGWTEDSDVDAHWDGAGSIDKADMAEYKVPLKDFNLQVCSSIFGLAGYHHWFYGSGDDYGWPSNQYYDQPRTWQPVVLGGVKGGAGCGANGKIAYVFRGNTPDALSFYSMLATAGYTVTLVPLAEVLTTDFSVFNLILIADDTGTLDTWGTPPAATGVSQVAQIILPNKPIMGIGEGGYAFFGKLSMFIGWPHGWHGPQLKVAKVLGAPAAIYNGIAADPVIHYLAPTNSVGIYIQPPYPSDVSPIGMEVPADDHANIIQQGCRMLWGSGGSPQGMTSPDGTKLFLNTVGFMRNFQCDTQPPPSPKDCGYTLQKTASPASGLTVPVGQVITYTLTYQLIVKDNCPAVGKLVDVIPLGTAFVPNSSGDGTTPDGNAPGADGAITWTVGTSAAPLTKVFKVKVLDNICAANKTVSNIAELRPSAAEPLFSNTVLNPVTCSDIGLPNTQPNYSEDELQIDPYPLVAGYRTRVSVRVRNLGVTPLTVTAQFQTSPAGFGIGLDYATTVGSGSATLPVGGIAVISTYFTPTVSGNQCLQATVSAPSQTPIKTQRCMDVTEVLQPGVKHQLTLPVRNNTGGAGTIQLVVNNTCPGFSAVVVPATLTGMSVGETRPVSLDVTPPNPVTLGSGCHIDLEAWMGDTQIGGIRKLDIAPVHLPENVIPPWEEPEIMFRPDPPAIGIPGQICIQLNNPLSTVRHVNVDFSVADFGAGIGFSPATTLAADLPANSIATYCADWTPLDSGTLHRCVLATLRQDGYLNQRSQKNIEIVRSPTGGLGGLSIPFVVGNPDLAGHLLSFEITLVGIDPSWQPLVQTRLGGAAPSSVTGGGLIPMRLLFPGGSAPVPAAPQTPPTYFGSQSLVEVQILMDGVPTSGFSVRLMPYSQFLPTLAR